MDINEHRVNALLWAVWGQGTKRLVAERPNGDRIDDQIEKRWRVDVLSPLRAEPCPHWAQYRDRAVPIVTEAARQVFVGQSDDEALQLLFRQIQQQPVVGMRTICQVARHPDLDRIVEANVWPWLEQKCAAAQPLPVPDDTAAGVRLAGMGNAAVDYRHQITPLAQFAYRFDALGTQISFFAGLGASAQMVGLDAATVDGLSSCAATLANHCAYIRKCAVSLRNASARSDEIAQRYTGRARPDDGEYQWWSDLTTRPITSVVRDEVAAAGSAEAIAPLLRQLADEADSLADELGEAFDGLGWNRVIIGSAAGVGPQLRELSQRLGAAG